MSKKDHDVKLHTTPILALLCESQETSRIAVSRNTYHAAYRDAERKHKAEQKKIAQQAAQLRSWGVKNPR